MKTKKKALIIATVVGFVTRFEMNDIKILQELGYDVVVIANYDNYNGKLDNINVEMLDIRFTRSPFTLQNIKAFKKLNKYVKENKIDLIHCHTPVGGVVGRIVGKLNNIKTVIYTAHGFHFFDGAPKLNWLIYYPVEKFLSRYTDILITINQEDYNRAKNKFYAKKVEHIPGVGIDIEKIENIKVDRVKKRKELGIEKDDILLLSVGELNKNKNHQIVIKALAELKNKKIKYFIAGKGILKEELENLIKDYGLEKNIKLLGYRNDIYELCKMSDIFIFPSLREGLGMAGLEALAAKLPIIGTHIHGMKDYIENNKNGFCIRKNDKKELRIAIETLINNKKLRVKYGIQGRNIVKKFDLKNTSKKMLKIYINR